MEYCRAAKLFADDPKYTPELNRICDFSQADLSGITLSDINTFAAYAVTNVPITKNTKVALVAPSRAKMGIFDKFSELISTGNLQFFRDPEEAVSWVQVPGRPQIVIESEVRQQNQQGAALKPATLERIEGGDSLLFFALILTNEGDDTAYNVIVDNPIPDGTSYRVGSSLGVGGKVMCSCDHGVSFHSENEQLHLRRPCTDVRWMIDKVPSGSTQEYCYQLIVNNFAVTKDEKFRKWLRTGTA